MCAMFKFDNGKDKLIIEQLESIPANSNPFHHDMTNMGMELDKEFFLMYSKFKRNDYLIIIDRTTGKRILLHLDNLFDSI
jgi:hypothetical protein